MTSEQWLQPFFRQWVKEKKKDILLICVYIHYAHVLLTLSAFFISEILFLQFV